MTTVFPDGINKLKGAFGIRFTMVWTFQSAHTPFHQGLSVIAFQPGFTNSFSFDRATVPWALTNIPHARLDMAADTMVILRVPYVSSGDFVDPTVTATNVDNTYGRLTMSTLLPIRAVSGLTSPTYKIYLSLEDVELVGVAPVNFATATFQSGAVATEIARADGLFSTPLSKLSTALRFVSHRIPSISSLTSPAAYYTDVATGVARIFGYSKPIVPTPPQPMRPEANAYENNVDLPSAMNVLASTSDNRVVPHKSFAGTDTDEMALAYILKKPSITFSAPFGTARAHGAILYATAISPSHHWLRIITGSAPSGNLPIPGGPSVAGVAQSLMPTTLLYFSQLFRYWRGSLKYRITFAKTKFHGGRVLLSYIPNINATPLATGSTEALRAPEGTATANVNLQPSGLSKLVDLRDGSVFEFEVPYLSPIPWTRFYDSIGTFSMTVMDPLLVSGNVSNAVDFIVEVSAGDDFQLSVPIGPRYPAPRGSSTAVRLQSGEPSSSTEEVVQYTTGEWLTSLKQLIMIPHSSLLLPGNYTRPASTTINYIPVDFPPWYYSSTTSTDFSAAGVFAIAPYVASAFAFVSGGTDYHFYLAENVYAKVMHYSNEGFAVPPTVNSNIFSPFSISNTPYLISGRTGTLGFFHWRFPAFQPLRRMWTYNVNRVFDSWRPRLDLTTFKNLNATNISTKYAPIVYPRACFTVGTGTTLTESTVRISAADDARCGYYLGPIPITLVPGVPSVNFTPGTDVDSDFLTGNYFNGKLLPPDVSLNTTF